MKVSLTPDRLKTLEVRPELGFDSYPSCRLAHSYLLAPRCTTSKRSFVQARSPRPPPRAAISLNPPCGPPPVPSHSPSLSAETAMKFQNPCLPHPLARAAETAVSQESYLAVAARIPMVPV